MGRPKQKNNTNENKYESYKKNRNTYDRETTTYSQKTQKMYRTIKYKPFSKLASVISTKDFQQQERSRENDVKQDKTDYEVL